MKFINLRSKLVRIILLTLFILPILTVQCFASYTSGVAGTPRYYSPLQFSFWVDGTTAELFPTISYSESLSPTNNVFSEITQLSGNVTSIERTSYTIAPLQLSTTCSVDYRLSFDVQSSSDDFVMYVEAASGFFDFQKYFIPYLTVPQGYECSYDISYSYYFTEKQETVGDHYKERMFGIVSGNSVNDDVPLLQDHYAYHLEQYPITCGIIVDSYNATLTFSRLGSGGDPAPSTTIGYYQWDQFLSTLPPALSEIIIGEDNYYTVWCNESIYLSSLSDGVVDGFWIEGFFIYDDVYGDTDLSYELSDGDQYMVYSMANETWYTMDLSAEYELTPIEVRTLYFASELDETFDLTDHASALFLSWFIENTIYSATNPLTTVSYDNGQTFSFTDGDGGMYIHYFVDRTLDQEFQATMEDLKDMYVSHGLHAGGGLIGGDFTSWLSTAAGGFLNFEFFPGFAISEIVTLIVAIPLVIMFLKYFAGG